MDAALVAACEAGDDNAVAQLLAAGADPNANGARPLLKASSNGHLGVVEQLLEAGADARAQASLAVLYACHGGHLDVIVRLEQAGADVRGRMKDMLESAVRNEHLAVLEHLLALGTAAPAGLPCSSSSRMTICPRMMVALGQPVTSMPSNAVHPARLAIQALVMVRLALRSTTVKSAS